MTKLNPWIASSDALSIFPTHIWRIEVAPKARDALNTKIVGALNSIRPARTDRDSAKGWQSRHDLHEYLPQEFRELGSYINDTVRTILRFLSIGYDAFEITACWANINPPGASHKSHSHPNNFLSGAYYVQTQKGADTINFHDPRVQTGIIRSPVTDLTAANTDQVVVRVNSGMLLVFPAYLQHSVDTNHSDKERISISFNIMFSSFTENLSKPLW